MIDSDDMPPALPPALRAALLACDETGPSDAQRQGMAAKLAAATGVSAAALLPPLGAGPIAGTGATAGKGVLAGAKAKAIVALAFVAGGAVGAIATKALSSTTNTPSTISAPALPDAMPAATPDAVLGSSDAPATDAPAAVAPRDAEHTRTNQAPVAPAPDAPPNADQLARENAFIDAARVALRAGNYQVAAQQVAEHRLRFANGKLAQEREMLAIEIALARGDNDGARRSAAAFRQTYPSSVFMTRLNELVAP